MSQDILFLAHRLPFPPDRGDKIRSHHILQRLARIAPVHVATFADDPGDLAHEGMLAGLARSYCLRVRSKPLWRAGLEAVFKREPVSVAAFRDENIARYVRDVIATGTIGSIYVFSGQMGQYVPDDFSGRVLMDLVDVDSAKFEAYAARRGGPMGWIEAREGRLLRAEEERLACRADVSLLVAKPEVDLFLSRLPEELAACVDVRVLGNGIDSQGFDPARVAPTQLMASPPGARLIFTGQMDYMPNITAAERVIERILPQVRAEIPDATFHVVGRNPPAALLDRHGRDGAFVWGRVDDIRPWLKAATLALVPLDIGRGVQNKVLEAMAMELPVVLTSEAATGIPGIDGTHFQIADSDGGLARAVKMLLTDTRRARIMGMAARRFVVEEASWRSALAALPEIIGWRTRPRTVRDAA